MSEPEEQAPEVYGDYHPEAAHYGAYNEAMAAWRNQVRSMQQAGALPGEPSPQPVVHSAPVTDTFAGTPSVEEQAASVEPSSGAEEPEEGPVATEPSPAPQQPATGLSGDEGEKQYFDPTEHNAIEVMNYLEGVGEAETLRVLDAEERSDRPRKGIVGQREALLKRARRNEKKKAEAASSSE